MPWAAVWSRKNRRWESHDGRYYFDEAVADKACDFFPTFLRHHIGEFAGQDFQLLDYQRKLLTRPIFGWKHAATGLRRFRKVFSFIPKGGGKSPWAAGTGLFLTMCDNEPAAEVYALAADKKQARIVHDNARIMVEESPALQEVCEVLRDSIYYAAERSTYQVLSADAKTKHGFRPHAAIFDEFHAQPNRNLFEAIKKSMVKRRQPLLILITHAGDDDEGICYEEYEYAKRVLSGSLDDEQCLPVIFEAQPEEDWQSPKVWQRVNPGHAVTVKPEAIAAEAREAAAEPRKRNDFLRFHLNRWVNQATAWIPIDWWDACRRDGLDEVHLQTLQCCAGLDLAQKWDLASFTVVFREFDQYTADGHAGESVDVVGDEQGAPIKHTVALNYQLTVVPFFWIPANTMEQHRKEDGVPYDMWTEGGLVTATDGDMIDYSQIYRDITETIVPRFPKLKAGKVGFDPHFAGDIAPKLRDHAGLDVVELVQNWGTFSESCYVTEALIKARKVSHDGHRLLRWNWENVAVKRDDAGRIRPVKPKRASKRVDGVTAMIMAIKALMMLPDHPRRSKYEDTDLRSV